VAFFNGAGAPGQLWLFWLAPLVGAAIAGVLYPLLFPRYEELATRPVRDAALERREVIRDVVESEIKFIEDK
jgi:aquaporin Z